MVLHFRDGRKYFALILLLSRDNEFGEGPFGERNECQMSRGSGDMRNVLEDFRVRRPWRLLGAAAEFL